MSANFLLGNTFFSNSDFYICKYYFQNVLYPFTVNTEKYFSDKDDKPEVPSHNSSELILWDVKEPLGT